MKYKDTCACVRCKPVAKPARETVEDVLQQMRHDGDDGLIDWAERIEAALVKGGGK